MQKTEISWTDYSTNPLKYRDANGKSVWACVKASPGCHACYSESLARRFNKGGPFSLPVLSQTTPYLDEKEVKAILTSKAISGKRVFPCDMTDFAGEWIEDEILDRLFAAFALRPDVEFQLLTKRAERLLRYCRADGRCRSIDSAKCKIMGTMPDYGVEADAYVGEEGSGYFEHGGLDNVLLGFSAENQEWYDKRLPYMKLLAAIGWRTWWSLEPLIGPIELAPDDPSVWVVTGSESGRKRRNMSIEWANSIQQSCKNAGRPFFMKQLEIDGIVTESVDVFPPHLRVREFPGVRQ